MTSNITVRMCHTLDEFQTCVDLQRKVWGEDYRDIKPVVSFIVSAHTGGQTIGAFDGAEMVGFTLSMAGLKEQNKPYLHSHMTGVLSEYRDKGVGRMLKLFQREEALSRGLRLVEWTFDPLEMRNAHFNINRLGAIVRRYYRNLYGVTSSPLHRGLPTDRLMAEWYLDSPHVIAAINGMGAESEAPVTIDLPADLDSWKQNDPAKVLEVQARVREQFEHWFARGYAAVGVRRTAAGNSYLLRPWSDF